MQVLFFDILENLQDALVGMFASLNYWVYSFIEELYAFLMQLADVQVFSTASIRTFSTRVYAILGIFMAFKLTFSFITYAVKPDDMKDSKKGGKQLIINIMIALVLLIAVPNLVFPLSRELQRAVLHDNILEQVILGADPSIGGDAADPKRAGRTLSFTVLNGFFVPDPKLPSADAKLKSACENPIMILDPDAPGDVTQQEEISNALYKLNGDCAAVIKENAKKNAGDTVFWYETAYSQKSIAMLLMTGSDEKRLTTVRSKDDAYLFKFNYLISLIVGAFVIIMLINFCFKIAVRAVKLGFLELIAPIPILSYIDPDAKNKSFSGWLKACTSTYLDLFIRLISLYFAIFVITSITTNGLALSDGKQVGGLTMVIIIIGALMFASEAPKLIEQVLGVKLAGDGKFSLNPFKGSPLASAALGGAVGLGAGMLGGGISNAISARNKYNQAKQKLDANPDSTWADRARLMTSSAFGGARSVFGGGISSSLRGTMAGAKSKNGFKGAGQGIRESNKARNDRQTFKKNDYGFVQRRVKDPVYKFADVKNEYAGTGKMDQDIQELKNQEAHYDKIEERQRERMSDYISRYSGKYGAESFEKAFERSDDADKELKYMSASGATAYDKYKQYVTQLNATRKDGNKLDVLEEAVFDRYSGLEKNVNYYNMEHEEIKKRIRTKEKTISAMEKAKPKD